MDDLSDYEKSIARRRMAESWPTAGSLQERFAEAIKSCTPNGNYQLIKNWTRWRWCPDPKWGAAKVIEIDFASGVNIGQLKEILSEFESLWREDLGIDHLCTGETYKMAADEEAEPKPKPKPKRIPVGMHLTDLGNSERLMFLYGGVLLYCHPWARWLVWDDRRWKSDDTANVIRLAKDTARHIYAEVLRETDEEERKRIARWALRSENVQRVRAMVDLARSEVPILPDQLDADPWMLTVANGVVDLRTGELLPHDPERLSTKLAEVECDRGADCPLWLQFLDEIMGGDKTMIRFLQKAVGYSLTGDTSERCLFILYGCGANGKTTFLEVIRALLKDYALRTPTETLLTRRSGSIPNDVARLKGARFVSASESEKGRRLSESLIKDITGRDAISARFMRAEWFDFIPECKIWLATNHKPEIRGTDKAIWDRIRLIPFEVIIPEEGQDRQLASKLKKELSGILTWAVEGCLTWQRDGLKATEKVKRATQGYRSEQDVLGEYITDCCTEGPDLWELIADLFSRYKKWGGDLDQRRFSQALRERGYIRERKTSEPNKGRVVWRGIGLADVASEG